MKKTTIVIVDDHKLIRELWATLFAGNAEFEIAGESGKLDEAIEMIKIKRPDIVLLDISMGSESGMDAVPLILNFSPDTRIIIISMHNQPAYAKKMLQSGVKAYVTKNSTRDEIIKAVEEVMKGNRYVCAEIKDALSAQITNNKFAEPDIKNLSLREIGIIKLIKEGLSSKEIALQLDISVYTVEVHRRHILQKLKLKNTASLVSFINKTDLTF